MEKVGEKISFGEFAICFPFSRDLLLLSSSYSNEVSMKVKFVSCKHIEEILVQGKET